ncbi:hypothetical protein AVEN_273582-1 [Araneus ventricosus]|uniref:Uncharacterized protein n=1 Tax=Araneus ventricosus TaxID=182803 RepID=A0A4Y2Q356_ARAVE|nr:hypothetical protein AVEN_273582-1 [Araneus ventricosus]
MGFRTYADTLRIQAKDIKSPPFSSSGGHRASKPNKSKAMSSSKCLENNSNNFFHEGKCRKKPPQPPEAQPIPTSRTTTIDNMDNDERESPGDDAPAVPAVICSSPTDSQTFSRPLPTAPEDLEAVLQAETPQQTLMKCESPPPYCESADRNYQVDYGPPPAYDEAIRGTDINVQQLWQAVFIVDPGTRENA